MLDPCPSLSLPLTLPSHPAPSPGYCDDEVAACYCPSHTKYGRIPSAVDAPLGSPPRQWGRPLSQWCQPNKTEDGQDSVWGTVDPELLWGPEGWCNADRPAHRCHCYIDGRGGELCEDVFEQVGWGVWLLVGTGSTFQHGVAGRVACLTPLRSPSFLPACRCLPACRPQFCFNQCNGRGECQAGYCKCQQGGVAGRHIAVAVTS